MSSSSTVPYSLCQLASNNGTWAIFGLKEREEGEGSGPHGDQIGTWTVGWAISHKDAPDKKICVGMEVVDAPNGVKGIIGAVAVPAKGPAKVAIVQADMDTPKFVLGSEIRGHVIDAQEKISEEVLKKAFKSLQDELERKEEVKAAPVVAGETAPRKKRQSREIR